MDDDKARALIVRWREQPEGHYGTQEIWEQCADELEEALSLANEEVYEIE